MTRYLVTSTGRKLHIVREFAYHSKIMGPPSLCGHHPKWVAGTWILPTSPPAPGDAPICRTCKRLQDESR